MRADFHPFPILCLAFAALTPGALAAALQASPPRTHPVQGNQPRPVITRPPAASPSPDSLRELMRQQEERRRFGNVPFALASRTDSALTYSRAINKITCVARVDSGGVEWVGTKLGVKRVDNGTNAVRVFGPQDGLPWGQVVSIAAAPDGGTVAAMVHTRTNNVVYSPENAELFVCVYTTASGRWRVLDTFKTRLSSPNAFYDDMSSPETPARRLAVTAKYIALFPPDDAGAPAPTAAREVVRLYDHTTASFALTAVRWNESLRADYDKVRVNAVAQVRETLYLATSIGLFALDTAAVLDAEPFRRLLPEYHVAQVAASPSGTFLALLAAKRNAYDRQSDYVDQDGLSLYRVSLPDGKLGEPLTPLRNTVGSGWRQLRGILSVADDETIWLTNKTIFARYESDPVRWHLFSNEGETIDPQDERAWGRRYGYSPSEKPLATAATVPDSAVLARALRGDYHDNPNWMYLGDDTTPVSWFRARFGRWLSPKVQTGFVPVLEGNSVTAVDSENPLVSYRIAYPAVLSLFPTQKDAPTPVSDDDYGFPFYRYASGEEGRPPLPKELARYPLSGGIVRLRPAVYGLFAVPGTPDKIVAHTAEGVLLLDGGRRKDAPAWVPVPMPPVKTPFHRDLRNARLLRAGDRASGRFYFVEQGRGREEDTKIPSASAVEPTPAGFTASAPERPQSILTGTSYGLWARDYAVKTQGNTTYSTDTHDFQVLPVSADGTPQGDWRRVVVAPPAEPAYAKLTKQSLSEPAAFTGSVVWYRLDRANSGDERYPHDHDSHRELRGYDVRRERWLAPLEMIPGYHDAPIISEIEGMTYAAASAPDGCVWRFDANGDGWQAVVPRIPRAITGEPDRSARTEFEQSIRLVAVRDGVYTLVSGRGKQVFVYESGTKSWRRGAKVPEQIAARIGNHSSLQQATFVPATGGDVYSGSEDGLWRLAPDAGEWSAVTLPTVWGETPAAGQSSPAARPSPFTLRTLVATKTDVFLAGSGTNTSDQAVLIRWNKVSRRATFLDEQNSGIAGLRGRVRALRYDGTSVWLSFASVTGTPGSGTYRYDAKSERFVRVLAEVADRIVPFPESGVAKQVYLLTQNALRRWLPSGTTETIYPASEAKPGQEALSSLLVTEKTLYLGVNHSAGGRVYHAARGGKSGAGWQPLGNVPPAPIESLRFAPDATGAMRLWVSQFDTRTSIRVP